MWRVAKPHATLEKNREEHVGGTHPKKRKKATLHLVPKLSTGTKVPN